MADIPNAPFSVDEIVELQRALVERYGGPKDRRSDDRQRAESALATACYQATLRSPDGEADPLHLAAGLLYYFASNQIFADGNKRIGLATCINYLYSIGLTIASSQQEVFEFVLRIASERSQRPSLDEVIQWLGSPERLKAAKRCESGPVGAAADLFNQNRGNKNKTMQKRDAKQPTPLEKLRDLASKLMAVPPKEVRTLEAKQAKRRAAKKRKAG